VGGATDRATDGALRAVSSAAASSSLGTVTARHSGDPGVRVRVRVRLGIGLGLGLG